MNEPNESSSLPLLLTISAAVLVTAAGGWFLLDDDFSAPANTAVPVTETRAAPAAADVDSPETEAARPGEEPGPEAAVDATIEGLVSAEPLEPDSPEPEIIESESIESESIESQSVESASQSLDANLRKARLAAEADMLAYPTDQSALFYYNQILEVDPGHEVANAEYETILGRIGQTSAQHLAAEEYAEAHALAVLVARKNPGHELVQEVTRELDGMTNEFVEVAIQHAQDGNDDQVEIALAAAAALPGRNPEYFIAVRDSIENIRNSRVAAEQNRLEQVRLAAVEATNAWTEKVRGAILAGRLVTPDGENAVAYLAERDSPTEEKEALQAELTAAILSECAAKIDSGSFAEAEQLLTVATDFLGDNDVTLSLQSDLDTALIDAESAKILHVDDFVRLSTSPPRYPRRAVERNIEGWVELQFTVTSTGQTADIEVQNAEPGTVFEQAAIDAVEEWTFQPRVFRGQVISQRAGTRLVFKFE